MVADPGGTTADRVAQRQDVLGREDDEAVDEPREAPVGVDRELAHIRAHQPRPMASRHVERDLRAGVARADDEDVAILQLTRVPVVTRVELADGRIELAGERRDARLVVGAGRDDDLIGLEPAIPDADDIAASAVVGARKFVDAMSGPDRDLEGGRVCLEVVGDGVLRRERVPRRRKRQTRQSVEVGRREDPQRVPAVPPRVADPVTGVEDHEAKAAPRQVVAGGQAGLAATDDDDVEPLGRCRRGRSHRGRNRSSRSSSVSPR